jgi:hypothetical protein
VDGVITTEQVAQIGAAWDQQLVTNGVEDLVVPQAVFQLDLKHNGWWGLLDKADVVGWRATLRDEGVTPTDELVADRVNAWLGLEASDEAYRAELLRVGDMREPAEEHRPGAHETRALKVVLVSPAWPEHLPGEHVAMCDCGWLSAGSYRGPLTAGEAGRQHQIRQARLGLAHLTEGAAE